MSPTVGKMLDDGSDEPLFKIEAPRRRRPQRRPGVRAYSGKAVTCHVCIIAVQRGEQLPFPRANSSWSLLTESGREWLMCDGHKALMDSGVLTL